MNLEEAPLGTVVSIERVGGDRSFRRRLLELGLVPGTRVEIVRVAPLGDPVELLVRGASLSIRRAEARALSVSRIVAPRASAGIEPDRARSLAGVPSAP